MSYTPTTWANGDTITAEKMNNIEQGVVDASSGGGVLVVNEDTTTRTLDKTWQQIADADFAVVKADDEDGTWTSPVQCVGFNDTDKYFVESMLSSGVSRYLCNTADGYPTLE